MQLGAPRGDAPWEQLQALSRQRGVAAGMSRRRGRRSGAGPALLFADEALSLEQPKRRVRRGEAQPWGAALLLAHPVRLHGPLPGHLHAAQAGSAPAGCSSRTGGSGCRPRGSLQELHRLGAQAGGTMGAVSHDKRMIDPLVCSAADLEQCPLFIPEEAGPGRVSSS